MQLLLPIFPHDVKLINPCLGVFEKEGIIFYLHNGVPIFSHKSEDLKSFRYITSNLIIQGVCHKIEIQKCFGVSYDSVKRSEKKLREKGERAFFTEENRRGSCYKLLPTTLLRMQAYLDAGKNNSEIARLESVSEGAVRYAIKTGKLKKKELTESGRAAKGSNRTERSERDSACAKGMGIATTKKKNDLLPH